MAYTQALLRLFCSNHHVLGMKICLRGGGIHKAKEKREKTSQLGLVEILRCPSFDARWDQLREIFLIFFSLSLALLVVRLGYQLSTCGPGYYSSVCQL